jgi:hypothetical protein
MIVAMIYIGLTVGLLGCSSDSRPLTAPCGVIVDGSQSGKTFDAAQRLKDTFPTFLAANNCKIVTFVPLNASSQGSVCTTPDLDINPDLGDNTDQQDIQIERRADALRVAESMLICARTKQPSLSDGSDVLGALARAVTQRPPGTGTYHVLVVSDLIEYANGLSLYDNKAINTSAKRTALISSLSRRGEIPNMTGMALEITDRGRDLSSQQDSDDFNAFWNELFASKAAGSPHVIYD